MLLLVLIKVYVVSKETETQMEKPARFIVELGLELRPFLSRVQALNAMLSYLSYRIWFCEQ